MERERIVAAIVHAAGDQLTGRVRLQKTAYLLDQLGFGSGFEYEYHHYGPYSRDLDNATADAKGFELIEEDFGRRASDGAQYSIFRLRDASAVPTSPLGSLGPADAAKYAHQFAAVSITVLELAATVHWLWEHEKVANWKVEIERRKGVKAGGGRLEKALGLLHDIGLAPPAQRRGAGA